MAQRVITQYVSDLSGKDLAEGEGRTVKFSYNGVDYSIDLTDQEADKFDKVLDQYINAATRIGGRRSSGGRSSSSSSSSSNAAIRQWAQENGYELGNRGRIPAEIKEAYEATN